MMNQNQRREKFGVRAGGLALGLAVVAVAMSGCGKKEPPPPPPAPTYTPPPPVPDPADVAALLQEMDADKRVQFPEDVAPIDVEYARAIISLADSFARGDDGSLRDLLDGDGRRTLDALVESGRWYDDTDRIEAVRVVYLTELDEEADEVIDEFGMSLSAETLRDQMLDAAQEEDVTLDELMSGLGIPNPEALGIQPETIERMMEGFGEQMAAGVFGAPFMAEMAELQREFETGGRTPEELVNEMYDRGMLGTMVEKIDELMASMGSMFASLGDSFGFGGGGAEVRLAIQEPGSAYALSFTVHRASDRFIFTPAPEANVLHVRASDFEGAAEPFPIVFEEMMDDLGDSDFGRDGTPGRRRPSDIGTPPSSPGGPGGPPSSPGG